MKRLIAWAAWSPRNAALTVVGLLAVIGTCAGMIATASTQPASQPVPPSHTETAAPAAGPAPLPKPTPTTGVTGEKDMTATAPAAQGKAAEQTATRFMDAWLSAPHTTHAAWLAAVGRDAAPQLRPFLAATPADAIPAATLTGVTTTDLGADRGTVLATLSDGSKVTVTVMTEHGRWVVADVQAAA